MLFFDRLKEGLRKTRAQIGAIVGDSQEPADEAFFESLEEALIAADVGMDLTVETIDIVRGLAQQERARTREQVFTLLKETLVRLLTVHKTHDAFPPKPWVTLVVGVNGVGKTTTIGKLAHELRGMDKQVMLGAADTFRAGAIEQLRIWSERTGSLFIAQHEGADAASVAYDAMEAAGSRGVDVLILDTAGRLHTKVNLMNELEKIVRVVKKHTPYAPNEILLVVDATTGQNALKQAEVFHDALGLTGLIITKLDGTSKGGMALALTRTLKLPIRKIGVGEGLEDLQDFNAELFVDAMIGHAGDL